MQKRAAKLARHSAVTQLQSEASQSILTLNSETEKPLDQYFFVLITLYLLGIGSLLSITTLFAAPDYLQLMLNLSSDQQILYFIMPSYILPNLLLSMAMVRYGHYSSFEIRITTSFIVTALCLISIPILFIDPIIGQIGDKWIFYSILLLSSIIGITSAILGTSILAFCQFFPMKYLRALVIGQSFAMIIICVVRIGIKLLIDLETGGVIYFSFTAGFNILCAVLFMLINTYHPFVAYYINPYLESKDRRYIERKIRQIEQNENKTNTNTITKTHSRSIRNSVAILPSQLSYFSNLKHFRQYRPTGKQHPNSPNKHKQSSPLQQQNNINIFYGENDINDDRNDMVERSHSQPYSNLSMPTGNTSILKKESKHKRTRSNTDNDIGALELKQQTNSVSNSTNPLRKLSNFGSNNLNDLSLSAYSIQSSEQLLANNDQLLIYPPKSQPDSMKSALITNFDQIPTRDHAASEIVVYPQTYISTTQPTKLSGATAHTIGASPQSPIESGYQLHYQAPSNLYGQNDQTSNFNSFSGMKYEFTSIAKKILKSIWSLFITFFVTYLVFPGIILDFRSQYSTINNDDWFPVILITEFCVMDLLGRQLNAIEIFNRLLNIHYLSSLRILLYPLFIILDNSIIVNDNIVYIVVGLCAFTNGYFVTAAFCNFNVTLYQHEQEVGAAFMQLASALAILGASIIAVMVYEMEKKYN